jgi:16S rRNA (uracil1498-N3)-methyltransferase
MYRFYIAQKITDRETTLTDIEQVHHMRDVLRLKAGDKTAIFDNEGNEYLCEISVMDKKLVILLVKGHKPARPQKWRLTIACAIPKRSKMDNIVDKLSQLGVDAIIPLETERAVVKLEEKQETRLSRWRKIALSAAEQSRRSTLPDISRIMSLKELLAEAGNYELRLIPTLAGNRKTVKEALAGSVPNRILAVIGPEGDFTEREIEQAVSAGFIPISLGDTILRVETAAIAIASYIKFALME